MIIYTGSPHTAFRHITPSEAVNATVFIARGPTFAGLSEI